MAFDAIEPPKRRSSSGSHSATTAANPVAVALYQSGSTGVKIEGKPTNRLYLTFFLHRSIVEALGWSHTERLTIREGHGVDAGIMQFVPDPHGMSELMSAAKGVVRNDAHHELFVVRVATERLRHTALITHVPAGGVPLMGATTVPKFDRFGSQLLVGLPVFPENLHRPVAPSA